jgi:hypothetical protein
MSRVSASRQVKGRSRVFALSSAILHRLLFPLLLAIGYQLSDIGLSQNLPGQNRNDLRGIVPGDQLEWEIQELEASIIISDATILNLQLFSPGFDPNDYRSALKGKEELGDERYDQNKGSVAAEFVLSRNKELIAQATYGVEVNRWVVFFRGQVEPGIYTLKSRFMGLGKNAFRLKAQTSVAGAATVLVNPSLDVFEGRPAALFNVFVLPGERGKEWVEPLVLNVPPSVLPLRVGIYDEDGPKEMLARVSYPDGYSERREVSGDRKWAYYEVREAGIIRFGFTQHPQSEQYSNTIGIRVEGCLEIDGDIFKAVPARPVQVSVVDTADKPVKLDYSINGPYVREVQLGKLPAGYRLKEIRTEGGEQTGETSLRFGCAGGSVQFVLERLIELPKPEPEPVRPEPVRPEPQPEPVKPQPEPVKPEPVKPQPEPVKPEPQPEPVKPEPVKPEPQPEPVQETPKPEPVKPEPQPEPVKPESPRPEWIQPALLALEPIPGEPLEPAAIPFAEFKLEPLGKLPEEAIEPEPQPEPTKPEPQAEPIKPEPLQPEPEPAKPEPIKPGILEVTAVLVLPSGEEPYNLPIRIGEQNLKLEEGRLGLELSPAEYTLEPASLGATIEGPQGIQVESGQTAKAHYRIIPEAKLSLEVDRSQVYVGEEVWLTAKVITAFGDLLPIDLSLVFPDCLEPLANPRTSGSVTADRQAVLRVAARVRCKGGFVVEARLAPWNQSAQVGVKAIQPATFSLEKLAQSDEYAVGSEAVFQLRVKNSGDEAGQVRLMDVLPFGLEGPSFNELLHLEAGAQKQFEVRARVGLQAPDSLTNIARLSNASGSELAQAQASFKVLRPKAELSRELDKKLVVPGEEVVVTLRVSNPSRVVLSYTLSDTPPDWLEPLEPIRFEGQTAPGEQSLHVYKARVAYGPASNGSFLAQLNYSGGNLAAEDQIQRVLLGLSKRVEPERMVLGNPAEFIVKLTNPLPRPIKLALREAPDPGLKLELPEDLSLELEAGQTRELRFASRPIKLGELVNQVTAFVGDTPASERARAMLKVLPVLQAQRLSTITLDFKVLQGQGDRLLITHLPPQGSQYQFGTARLDGSPIGEPRIGSDGRLYFELPYKPWGQISYELRHRDALGKLEASTLTLRSGEREVFMQGTVSFGALTEAKPIAQKAREGLIQEPLPGSVFRSDKTKVAMEVPGGAEVSLFVNGQQISSRNLGLVSQDGISGLQRIEYYGLELKPGSNILEARSALGSDRVEVFLAGNPARLEVRPIRVLADGRTPLEFEIRALDRNGLTAGFGPLTIESQPEPLEPDAFPRESGYQLLLKDGVALLRLKPMPTPGPVSFKLAFDSLQMLAEFFVVGKQGSLGQVQASLGLRIGDSLQVFAMGRGYLETPLEGGTLQAAADGDIRWRAGVPDLRGGLAPEPDPTKAYPLTGSGSEARLPLRSDEPFALRYDTQRLSLSYYADALSLPGVGGLPQGTALRIETRGDLSLQGFAGYLPVATQTEEIVPDGTRSYRLSQAAQTGSEVVVLLVGAGQGRLERLKDYVLDGPSGVITLARPLWPTSADFQAVRLRISYAPLGGARELGYGVGARYKSGGFSVGAGAAYLAGMGWRYGVEAGYQEAGFNLRTSYSRGQTNRWLLELAYKGDAMQAQGNLTYETRLQGQARVGLNLSDKDSLSLEHQASGQDNRTGLLYQHKFGDFSIGGGLGYTWETLSTNLLARVAYTNGAFNTTLTHAQPFSLSQQAQTRLRSVYGFDFDLALETDLVYTWGAAFSGVIGLNQKLAGANLALAYQLPGASGEGNRARFGLEAPFPLSEHWSLNASAGYEYGLASNDHLSAFGLALRYQSKDFSATLGGETSMRDGQAKVTLRSGATGQLDSQQTLSFDANYQVFPSLGGSFTLAYALRAQQLSLLTYHRLTSSEAKFEGALALNYSPSPSFQLRPNAAYLIPLSNTPQAIYQLGLGGNWYMTDWLGIGAGYSYMFQPSGSSASAFSVEGSLKLLDGLWFNLGYTFGANTSGGFEGLSPDTYPGFYLRFDFLGGNR